MPENPGPRPAVADAPFDLPFFTLFLAACLSAASAVRPFPWGSELICDVVEQAHRKRRMRRQQPNFNDGIHSFLSWLRPCRVQDRLVF
jgi:hypothetical protein